jgi:putative ABC transport system permease protein
VLTLEPERGTGFFNIAPRLFMHVEDVPGTGLIRPGSRVAYYLYAAGSPEPLAAFEGWAKARLERGQRIDNLESGRPEVRAGDRPRRALPRPHRAPRRSARRRGDRARDAALRRAPSRRLRR